MTKWFGCFKDEGKSTHFKLIASRDLPTAEMMAEELAIRDKNECIGVIVAPRRFT